MSQTAPQSPRSLNAPRLSDAPRLSELPRYSLPELAAIPSGARQRLARVSRLLVVLMGLMYAAWQPVMLWLTPGARDPLWIRLVITALFGLAALASLRQR